MAHHKGVHFPVLAVLVVLFCLSLKESSSTSPSSASSAPPSSAAPQLPPMTAEAWKETNDKEMASSLPLESLRGSLQRVHAVFSDVDGTLVHYHTAEQQAEDRDESLLLHLPKSSTGMKGVISHHTLSCCARIRRIGRPQSSTVKLALVSGMRTTTLFGRLPYLPLADAYASENGGRIFYPKQIDTDNPQEQNMFCFRPPNASQAEPNNNYCLYEDMAWRNTLSGMHNQHPPQNQRLVLASEIDPIAHRPNPDTNNANNESQDAVYQLQKFAQTLRSQGWVVDDKGYQTCLRIRRSDQTHATVLQQLNHKTPNSHLNKEEEEAVEEMQQRHFRALLQEQLEETTKSSPSSSKSDPENNKSLLIMSENLGCVDVYPKASGKKNCCQYLMEHTFSTTQKTLDQNAVFLCDDDNDVEMALASKAAFLPSLTSPEVLVVSQNYPEKIIAASRLKNGVDMGTTDATDVIMDFLVEGLVDQSVNSV